MHAVLEQEREIPVSGSYDVIVCGGGPAGVAAAVAAARCGASVLLLEVHGCLGGIWTAGALSWIIDWANKPGMMQEIVARLDRMSGEASTAWGPSTDSAAAGDSGGRKDSFAYEPEAMKLVLEEMCLEAGIAISLHTRVVSALKSGANRLTHAVTESKSGRQAWQAAVFIDATGDGDLSALAGCRYDVGHPDTGETQPMSLMALLTGMDVTEVGRFCMNNGVAEDGRQLLLAQLNQVGIRPTYAAPSLIHIKERLFALMANHEYGVSATDAGSVTKATLQARAEVHRMVKALRSLGGSWSDIRVVCTADQIGVREGRRIHGHYCVDRHDVVKGARHPDAVARVTYWVDIHATNAEDTKAYGDGDVKSQPYDIPMRALIARDTDGLLMAGRCISGDFFAHASYRVTGNAVAMGEAAGTAAALSAKLGVLPQALPWELLKEQLRN